MDASDDAAPAGVIERIQAVLDGFRPRLRRDGSDIILVDLSSDGVLRVRLTGHHANCPVAVATLQSGIEDALGGPVPEVKHVVAVK